MNNNQLELRITYANIKEPDETRKQILQPNRIKRLNANNNKNKEKYIMHSQLPVCHPRQKRQM